MATQPTENRIMTRMLDRLFAAILSGPSMNCRPHNSRQRIDWTQLADLQDIAPTESLLSVLSSDARTKLVGRAEPDCDDDDDATDNSDEQTKKKSAWDAQNKLLRKLRLIAEESRTYENDTGAYVLNVGFPILSIPPGTIGGGSRRVLAPLAFIPVSLSIKAGATPKVDIECKVDGVDRVVPNDALLAWLEQQTGSAPTALEDIDDEGSATWAEIASIARHVCTALEIEPPPWLADIADPEVCSNDESANDAAKSDIKDNIQICFPAPGTFELAKCPRADEAPDKPAILPSAVMGLFPNSNQGLIRDTRAMIAGEALSGPVEPFLSVAATMDDPQPQDVAKGEVIQQTPRFFTDERFVARADPCQARAVRAARDSKGLVVHGPPGTGKSQTITNVIGDHLARGERVLFVCDKRTALDVVANRLRALGVGDLCAVVHDPQRDQLDLYRSVRKQLENLTRIDTNEDAEKQLTKIDAELSKIYGDLRDTHKDLHAPHDGLPSFHELVGEWLSLSDAALADIDETAFAEATLAEIEPRTMDLQDLFDRAQQVNFAGNIWTSAAGVALDAYMTKNVGDVRNLVATVADAAQAVDATIVADAPTLHETADLQQQAGARAKLADTLALLRANAPIALRERWLTADATARKSAHAKLVDAADHFETLAAGPLDSDLAALTSDSDASAADLARQMLALDEYSDAANKWYGFLLFGRKKAGKEAMRRYGIAPNRENAERLRKHLAGVRSRNILTDLARDLTGGAVPADIAEDTRLRDVANNLRDLLASLHTDASDNLANVNPLVEEALSPNTDDMRANPLLTALRSAVPRVQSLEKLNNAIAASGIITPDFARELESVARRNEQIAPTAQRLVDEFETLEDVLRTRAGHKKLPANLQKGVGALLLAGADTDTALAALRRGAVKREIDRRMKDNVRLPTLDAHRLETMIDRFQELEGQKRDLVREAIFHQWVTKQKQRLLASTGNRLNSLGADMKRRLLLRGKNRLRLRQVIALGQSNVEGDPLFDLAPVWLASPETVAQIFPRLPMFDIIMFDEASQVRLEEALPVLTRAQRVFIAGDPKQLPPTRFFESAVADTEQEEIETEQDLFEVQQSSVEDLLDAALNLDIPQSYLDVHYRSKSPDLIGFSNDYFYDDRLQPLPGHPARLPTTAPVRLIRADGIYEKRTNAKEADRVCELVRELLDQKKPPSIGIASFNIAQRDLIAEKLDDLALADEKFATRLADARSRSDDGEFRGLFVKNLENVQGDERDHIIISTTYGPDPNGRFYRRFGPLGMAGGGRRLNVLVTRAKQQVHVVTSVPRSQYETLPPIPEGQSAAGGWLLFAYLQFADKLTDAFAALEPAKQTRVLFDAVAHGSEVKQPSLFAAALAQQLETRGNEAASPWGNDGFCIDVAFHRASGASSRIASADHGVVPASGSTHPTKSANQTNGHGDPRAQLSEANVHGVLCDFNRYKGSDDPVDWEIYRTGIFNMMGWHCRRVWTPTFVRDAEGVVKTLVER